MCSKLQLNFANCNVDQGTLSVRRLGSRLIPKRQGVVLADPSRRLLPAINLRQGQCSDGKALVSPLLLLLSIVGKEVANKTWGIGGTAGSIVTEPRHWPPVMGFNFAPSRVVSWLVPS